jgi:uncharacterized protein involved in cysteine biosynthesis
MKPISFLIKYIVVPLSTLIGLVFAIDSYIVQRANTAIQPTQAKVESIKDDLREIKDRTKRIESILMEKK